MEDYAEKEPVFTIESPAVEDALAIARAHIQSWKETYIVPESGLTEEKIDELLNHFLTDPTFRENVIKSSLENPDEVLYRVVKNVKGEIVGFLHGSKHEDYNALDGMYLLAEAKGTGTGGKLMEKFLDWIEKDKKSRLEVYTYNHSAIGFYKKYGFEETDTKLKLVRDLLPSIEMIRPPDVRG